MLQVPTFCTKNCSNDIWRNIISWAYTYAHYLIKLLPNPVQFSTNFETNFWYVCNFSFVIFHFSIIKSCKNNNYTWGVDLFWGSALSHDPVVLVPLLSSHTHETQRGKEREGERLHWRVMLKSTLIKSWNSIQRYHLYHLLFFLFHLLSWGFFTSSFCIEAFYPFLLICFSNGGFECIFNFIL